MPLALSPAERNFFGFHAIVASPVLTRLLESVERLAKSSAAVLITGETGSGKELVARAIHHYSMRSHRPWVDVNCGVLPESLMESELFGHERGAFSGADRVKVGFFELAHQGTLFLDEIGELDGRMQVKLLRVLDGVPYYRLGGTKKVAVDVRIVAATNRDLEELAEQGQFRNDLLHRLNQVSIHVPPLRERPEDILALADHFLRAHNPEGSLSERAQQVLLEYSWPGNIRELRNVITRAALFSGEPLIEAADLTMPSTKRAAATPQGGTASTLDVMERRSILDALAQTNGHQRKAAERLGISSRTLSRKLKTYALASALT